MSPIDDEYPDIWDIINRIMQNDFHGGFMRVPRYSRNKHEVEEKSSYIDMQADDEFVYVTIELRERNESDIELSVSDDILTLKLLIEGTYHEKPIPLPTKVIPKSMKKSFNNGILDITLKRAEEKI